MIVTISRENCKLKVSSLPFHEVARKVGTNNYDVCVRSFYAEFDEIVYNKYVTICSSLVEKSDINPNQEILSFNNNCPFQNKIDYKPNLLVASPTWHPLRFLTNPTQGSFSVIIMQQVDSVSIAIENNKTKLIKKLHLQLEFRARKCSMK